MEPLNIVLHGSLAQKCGSALRERFGERATIMAFEADDPAALDPEVLAVADVMISAAFDDRLPSMPRLRLLQLPVSGLDAIDLAAVPEGCPVCNVFEHDIGISEYVLGRDAALHGRPGRAQRSVQGRQLGGRPVAAAAPFGASSRARASAASAMARSGARSRAGPARSACRCWR